MTKFNRGQIQDRARGLLEQAKGEVRWGELLKDIHESAPETPRNSIVGALTDMFRRDDSISKVARGTYLLKRYQDAALGTAAEIKEEKDESSPSDDIALPRVAQRAPEAAYYQSFAEFLRDDLEEVNEAVELGGNGFGGKWGTPDVIGVRKPNADDLISFERQIVVAEIKIDAHQAITAFGQAVAYRLFAHRSYVVMPNSISKADLDRLIALCSIYGIGLVTFDENVEEPAYHVRVNAQSVQPDMYYVNEMARVFSVRDPKRFRSIF